MALDCCSGSCVETFRAWRKERVGHAEISTLVHKLDLTTSLMDFNSSSCGVLGLRVSEENLTHTRVRFDMTEHTYFDIKLVLMCFTFTEKRKDVKRFVSKSSNQYYG